MTPTRRAEQNHMSQPSSCRWHGAARTALACSSTARSCGFGPPPPSHVCAHMRGSPDTERCAAELLLPSARQQYPPLVLELWLMSFHRVLYKYYK